MYRIYRYALGADGRSHSFNLYGNVLHVHSRMKGTVEFWAEFQENAPGVPRTFQVFGTGHDIPEDAKYVGTAMDHPYVWHLFELET